MRFLKPHRPIAAKPQLSIEPQKSQKDTKENALDFCALL